MTVTNLPKGIEYEPLEDILEYILDEVSFHELSEGDERRLSIYEKCEILSVMIVQPGFSVELSEEHFNGELNYERILQQIRENIMRNNEQGEI